jgi:hypothetical protein
MCVINILFITPYGKLQFRIQTHTKTDLGDLKGLKVWI